MKIQYLGTAAAEGFPAVFCNCPFCREARRAGGKNVRTRSQSLIDDTLLIDLPADSYFHFLTNGIQADRIQNLLVTHSHADHLYVQELEMRGGCFGHDARSPELHIWCGEGAYQKILAFSDRSDTIRLHLLKPYETAEIGGFRVTPLPARHFPGDGALIYIIQKDKTLLYAHDTGFFYDEVFDFIREKGFVFDILSLDCTFVDNPASDDSGHMGLENIDRLVARLEAMGAACPDSVKVLNHFSHNGNPLQARVEELVKKKGYLTAYDGRAVTV